MPAGPRGIFPGLGEGDHGVPRFSSNVETTDAEGGQTSSVGVGDELFTDLELMEDSRAIDFSVRSFKSSNAEETATGGRAGRTRKGGGSGKSCASSTVGSGKRDGSCGSRPGHYYDWFVSKLEGKGAGIIRGDIDARGKRVVRQGGGTGDVVAGEAAGARGGEEDDSNGLKNATLEELLEHVRDMVEELDVPDDHLSKDRHTQGEP